MTALLDIVKKGSIDRSVTIRIVDSTDGTPETGVVFNTSGIDLWYRREGAAVTSITEATLAALTTAHTDGGFLHISHGEYRLDLPDAAYATGANHFDVGGTVTGMVVIGGRTRLVDYDPEDVVRLGLTALPNAIFNAAGGFATMVHRAGTLPAQTGASAAAGTVNLGSGDINATNEFVGQTLKIFSAALALRGIGLITAADNANDRVTLNNGTALTFTPASGDTYVIEGGPGLTGLSATGVADAVLDAVAANYNDAGSIGEAINNAATGGVDPSILVSTTIATLASQVSFTLTAGSADNSAYLDAIAVITDSATAVQKAVAWISAYTGSTKTVTLAADPAIFTMAVGDSISILATPKRLATAAIQAGSFAAGAINAAAIADAAIDAATFAAGAITATALATNVFTSSKFATGAIDANAIATGAITAAKFAASAIDATAIATGAITAAKFAAGAIDATAIASAALTAAKFATDAIDANAIAATGANEIRDAIFARTFSASYGSYSFDEFQKMFAAALLGKVSGMATNAPVFRNLADNADVIAAATDANGNRTSVTRTP